MKVGKIEFSDPGFRKIPSGTKLTDVFPNGLTLPIPSTDELNDEFLKALEWLEINRPALKLGQRHNIAKMIAEYVENRGLKSVVK